MLFVYCSLQCPGLLRIWARCRLRRPWTRRHRSLTVFGGTSILIFEFFHPTSSLSIAIIEGKISVLRLVSRQTRDEIETSLTMQTNEGEG